MVKAKPKYINRVYVVELEGGRSHPEWVKFSAASINLNGKTPDYGGTNRTVLIGTHHDPVTLRSMITIDITDSDSVIITELTAKTLLNEHRRYTELVENYYLRFNTYPHIR